jgi:hypothetical protein
VLEAPGSLDATALASLPALRNLIGSTASRAWIQPHTDGRRNNPMMRGLPWPLRRGHRIPLSATRMEPPGRAASPAGAGQPPL